MRGPITAAKAAAGRSRCEPGGAGSGRRVGSPGRTPGWEARPGCGPRMDRPGTLSTRTQDTRAGATRRPDHALGVVFGAFRAAGAWCRGGGGSAGRRGRGAGSAAASLVLRCCWRGGSRDNGDYLMLCQRHRWCFVAVAGAGRAASLAT